MIDKLTLNKIKKEITLKKNNPQFSHNKTNYLPEPSETPSPELGAGTPEPLPLGPS